MYREPVFVVGIERSGTSLMYALLASHPGIAMTRRTNLWRYFYKRYGDLSRPENLERCLAAMMFYKRLRVLHPDPGLLREAFWQGEPTYERLFRLLIERHLEVAGKPRWGDKSLHAEHYIEDIFAVYPKAKIIHMIRDPRDGYASFRTGLLKGTWLKKLGHDPVNRNDPTRIRRRYGRGGIGAATARWLASARLACRSQQHHFDHYKIVRYEDLVSWPEGTVRGICSFIGEEYAPKMLSMEGAQVLRDKGGNSSYGRREAGSISTSSVGRFREVLSQQEIAFMQELAGRYMAAYGYHMEPLSMSLAERAELYFIRWPINVAWMVAKGTAESLKDQMGRTPPPHSLIIPAETV